METVTTDFVLDGGNVVLETQDNIMTAKYIRAMNLVSSSIDGTLSYYLYNAHGDVVQLTNSSGVVTKTYEYDAFEVEDEPDAGDANPFRYCGECFDSSSGTYYLRARYYQPSTGRFLAEDTHWNPGNMIYGDNPQDPLGLGVYRANIAAIMQSGNLYIYCGSNPIMYVDPSGEIAITTLILIGSIIIGLAAGGYTAYQSYQYTGQVDWAASIMNGLSWGLLAYTLGMTAYSAYLDYCAYYGI